ncbi:hypothetical protein [Streptomyces sp. NPDC001348]
MSASTSRLVPGRLSEWYRERRSWELSEQARAELRTLEALLAARQAAPDTTDEAKVMLRAAAAELESAGKLLSFGEHRRAPLGSHVTAARIHLETARLLWIKSFTSSPQAIDPYVPGLRAVIREHLARDDERRAVVEALPRGKPLTRQGVVRLIQALEAANEAALRENLRAGSFVRIVWAVTGGLFALAVTVCVITAVWPMAVPLCFSPRPGTSTSGTTGGSGQPPAVGYTVVCPLGSDPAPSSTDLDVSFGQVATRGDYIAVETVGLVAASLASASSLRKIRGTSTPYPIPVALAALKLPAGALTAVGGLLLMRGGFVPGLSALDTSAQIIAWAIVFGYSQELFTKFVDQRGQMVLDAVRGPSAPAVNRSGGKPPAGTEGATG